MNKFLLSNLNDEQKRAVTSDSSKIIVLAGAGAGKTRVISERVGFLLSQRISPKNIFCITFTRSAASEMKQRIIKVNKKQGKDVFVNTFHMFCIKLLRKYSSTDFMIISDSEKDKLISDIIKRFKVNKKTFLKSLKEGSSSDLNIQSAIKDYEFILKRYNLMDLDLLLPLTYKLLEDINILNEVREEVEFLIYDEAQDMNPMQYNIVERIMPPKSNSNLMLVGDDSQSIYGWNGTNVDYILNFSDKYDAETIILDKNYRSSNQIISAANNLIAHNQKQLKKSMIGFFDSSEIRVINSEDIRTEYIKVLAETSQYINSSKKIGILCRTNAEVIQISNLFNEFQIDFSSSIKPPENTYIIEWLNLACNPDNDLLIDKLYKVDKKLKIKALQERKTLYKVLCESKSTEMSNLISINNFIKYNDALKSFDYICKILKFEDMKLRDKIQKWIELAQSLNKNISLNEFLIYQKTKESQEILKESKSNINILTIHASKGLEYDVVMIVNCEKHNFNRASDSSEIEESRRLFYVAITRAKEKLLLFCPDQIYFNNKLIQGTKSCYLDEIFEEVSLCK